MRNLKKILSLALALVMVLSMMVTASAAFDDQDLIAEEHAEAIAVMAEIKVLQGNGTSFNPKGTLTRAEAAVILAKVYSGSADAKTFTAATAHTTNPFTDVPAWAVPYVVYCYQNDIVKGRNETTYDPSANVTGYEFGKMLLVAAGLATGEDFPADSWKLNVFNMAYDNGLLATLEDLTMKNPISREQASQMALNAMKHGTSSKTVFQVVTKYGVAKTFEDPVEAEIYAAQLKSYEIEGVDVKPVTKTTAGLLEKKFNVKFVSAEDGGMDGFGRAANTYVFNAGKRTAYSKLFYTETPVATYDKETSAKLIATDLKGFSAYEVKNDTDILKGVVITVDGEDVVRTDKVAEGIADLTDNNAVVEVYANSDDEITKIVVTTINYAEVSVDEVDDVEYVTVAEGIVVPNTMGLKDKDVVAYTAYGSTLANIAKLTGFAGRMESFLKSYDTELYSINGKDYTLVGAAQEWADDVKKTIDPAVDPLMFYVGANNTIVMITEIADSDDTTAPVVNKNFAQVLKTGFTFEYTKTVDVYGDPSYTFKTNAEATLLLTDGTTVKVPVAIEIASKADAKLGVAAKDVYYVFGGKAVILGNVKDEAGVKAMPEAGKLVMEGALVSYDDEVMAPAKTALPTQKEGSANVYKTTSDTIVSKTPMVGDIVINSNTTFVIGKYNTKNQPVGYQTVKGLAAIAATEDHKLNPDYVVYEAKWVLQADGETYKLVKTALYIFDKDYKIPAAQETPAEDVAYLYNSMAYVSSYDAEAEDVVYTVFMIGVDSKPVQVKMSAERYDELADDVYEGYGVFVLDTKGEVTRCETAVYGVVEQIVDNYVKLLGRDGWYVLSDTVQVAGDLSVGDTVAFVDLKADNTVDLVWVTIPAEA